MTTDPALTIRASDPAVAGPTQTYGPYTSAEACRRLVHLAFRDAHTALLPDREVW